MWWDAFPFEGLQVSESASPNCSSELRLGKIRGFLHFPFWNLPMWQILSPVKVGAFASNFVCHAGY